MTDWALLLWAMTASHHQWPMPPAPEPAAVVQKVAPPAPAPSATLPEAEREELRQALERLAPTFTGRLVYDPATRLYVPEVKSGTERGDSAHR